MKQIPLTKISFLLFFFSSLNLWSQDVQIETTQLQIVDNKLEISYDFIKSKKTNRFEVWVEISNSKGVKIDARTFSGDIGKDLLGGTGKKIIWDYNSDGIVLDEEINVDVKANISTIAGAVSPGKEFMKSLVFPGWGLSSIDEGKPYWLLGVIGYGSLGSSLLLRSNYKDNYEKYLNSNDPTESTAYYDKSQSQKSLSQVFTYAAIGTWTVSAIWTIVKANKANSSLTYSEKNRKLIFYSNYNPVYKTTGFTLKYNF